MGIALVEQKVLQHKLDFHVFMLEIFKGLLTIMEVDHVKILTKNGMATKAWKNIVAKVGVWKW